MPAAQQASPVETSLTDMIGNVLLLVTPINMADYPDYAACFRVCDRPGVHLCENYAYRGTRISVVLGYSLCSVYYYLCILPRVPFAQRALHPLHHYLIPCGGYATLIGLAAGLLTAAAETARSVTPDALAAQHARERARARAAWARYLRRREAELRAKQPWWDKMLVACRLQSVWMPSALATVAQGKDWFDYVEVYGVEWVARHSMVQDARWYAPETAAAADVADHAPIISASPALAFTTLTSSSSSLSPPRVPRFARFTKSQVDWIVSRVTRLRHCADEMQWMKTASVGGWTTGVATVLLWNGHSAPFRLSMGFGLGVVSGALLSILHLDEYLLSQ